MGLFSKFESEPEPNNSSLDELKGCIAEYSQLIRNFNGEIQTEVLEPLANAKRNIERDIEELKQSQNPPISEQVIEYLEGLASSASLQYAILNSWMKYLMTGKENIEERFKKIEQ